MDPFRKCSQTKFIIEEGNFPGYNFSQAKMKHTNDDIRYLTSDKNLNIVYFSTQSIKMESKILLKNAEKCNFDLQKIRDKVKSKLLLRSEKRSSTSNIKSRFSSPPKKVPVSSKNILSSEFSEYSTANSSIKVSKSHRNRLLSSRKKCKKLLNCDYGGSVYRKPNKDNMPTFTSLINSGKRHLAKSNYRRDVVQKIKEKWNPMIKQILSM